MLGVYTAFVASVFFRVCSCILGLFALQGLKCKSSASPPSTLPLKDLIQIRIRNPQFAKGLRFSTGLLGDGWGAISPIGSRELARDAWGFLAPMLLLWASPQHPELQESRESSFLFGAPPSFIDTQCMFVARMNLLKYRAS